MHRLSMLDGCIDWHVVTNLEDFVFLTVLMTQHTDIVICSIKLKKFSLLSKQSLLKKFQLGISA